MGQIAKSVIFRRRADGAAVLVVTSGDRRVDEKRVAAPRAAGPGRCRLRQGADRLLDRRRVAAGACRAAGDADRPRTVPFRRDLGRGGPSQRRVQAEPGRTGGADRCAGGRRGGWPPAHDGRAMAAAPCRALHQRLPHGRATGWCEGCLRTLDEIAPGAGLDDDDKRAVLARSGSARCGRRAPAGTGAGRQPAHRGPTDETHRFPLRRHLALCLAGLRAAAAGAGRAAASWWTTGRCCWPACWATGARRGRPRSSPSAPGPSARCTGWRSSTASPLDTPRPHPFNPLPLQRLALARPAAPQPARGGAVFRHVWGVVPIPRSAALAALAAALAPLRDPAGDEVKAELRRRTDGPCAAGVFGVPTFVLRRPPVLGPGRLPMLAAALQGDAWFDGPAWDREGAPAPRRAAPLSTTAPRGCRQRGCVPHPCTCQSLLGQRQSRVSAGSNDPRS